LDSSNSSWQRGYGAFSVGISQVQKTVRYIEHQLEHHRRPTFQEKYIAFLKEHGAHLRREIPKYLWDVWDTAVHLTLKTTTTTGNRAALLVQAALLDSASHILAQASDTKAIYAAPAFSYALTTSTDPVKPGQTAQFTVTVTNLSATTQSSGSTSISRISPNMAATRQVPTTLSAFSTCPQESPSQIMWN
jgi:hypothetical protein